MSAIRDFNPRTKTMVSLDAVVYPRCVCGRPWPEHRPVDDVGCQGYQPVRPLEDRGTVAYAHRRRLCRVLYRLERAVRAWRESLERRS